MLAAKQHVTPLDGRGLAAAVHKARSILGGLWFHDEPSLLESELVGGSKIALSANAGPPRDPGYAAITVPYLRVQLSLHRAHRIYNIIVGCRFNDPIADDSALGVNAVNLIFLHRALTQARPNVGGQPATYSYLWLKPRH